MIKKMFTLTVKITLVPQIKGVFIHHQAFSGKLAIVAEVKCLFVFGKHDTEALRSPSTIRPESFRSTHEWLNLDSKLGTVSFHGNKEVQETFLFPTSPSQGTQWQRASGDMLEMGLRGDGKCQQGEGKA